MSAYEEFEAASRQIADLEGAESLMNWDQEVMMPSGAGERRAQQMATLAGFIHQLKADQLRPALENALQNGQDERSDRQQRNLHQAHKHLEKELKLPHAFVAQMAQTTSESQQRWAQAKEAGDYSRFAPKLKEVFDLKQQEAEYYGYQASPYDPLLDNFEPGMTARQVSELFEALKPELRQLLDRVQAAEPVDDRFLKQPVPQQQQMQLSDWVYQLIGLDFNHARSDLATHPFTSGTAPEDIRVTTRIDENDLAMMFFSSIHEGGHALYEQGLGRNAYGLPEAEPCSLSVHESQSRIWENNVARGQAFWTYVRDTLARYYPDGLQGYDSAAVFRAVNRIEPSLIRISADELTYHFHIMLRFEIERAIMEGDAGVDDIPELWHEKVRSYLGLSIPDEAHGALQDIHWSLGAVGYFPTYSLGSLYAAQFYHYAHAANPDMEERFRQGDFSPLNRWLAQNIYAHGRLMDSPKLCEAATGEQLNPDYFLTYMRQKLQAVYNIQW